MLSLLVGRAVNNTTYNPPHRHHQPPQKRAPAMTTRTRSPSSTAPSATFTTKNETGAITIKNLTRGQVLAVMNALGAWSTTSTVCREVRGLLVSAVKEKWPTVAEGPLPRGARYEFPNSNGDFSGTSAAEDFLTKHGYSFGPVCGPMPRGIAHGYVCIAKWRNIPEDERKSLDGEIRAIDGDARGRGVEIVMYGDPE